MKFDKNPSSWERRFFVQTDELLGVTRPTNGFRIFFVKAPVRQHVGHLWTKLNAAYDFLRGPSIIS